MNSRDRNFTGAKLRHDLAASQERLERYLQQMDEMDAGRHGRCEPQQGAGSGTKDYGSCRLNEQAPEHRVVEPALAGRPRC